MQASIPKFNLLLRFPILMIYIIHTCINILITMILVRRNGPQLSNAIGSIKTKAQVMKNMNS
jgi:hypothetical protein